MVRIARQPGAAAGLIVSIRIPADAPAGWVLYLLECTDGSFYAGITNDLPRRMAAHATGRGARYTRSHPPRRLVGVRAYPDRATASRAEWQIKQLPRRAKPDFLHEAHAGI